MAGRSEPLARRESRESEPMVPVAYAEKTMSTLLRLHEDLVEEKERRIDLYRRLMDREQELAELRAYVRLLEAELARRGDEAPSATPAEGTRRPEREEPPAPVPPRGEGSVPASDAEAPVIAWMPANLRRV